MPAKSSIIPWMQARLREHNSNECLLWEFSTTAQGYGHVGYKHKMVLAHRLAFYFTYGRWPVPCGLHTCDTPRCFNPRHIFEGTRAQNNADAGNKSRKPFGIHAYNAKLTPELVRQIRNEYIPWKNGYLRLAHKFKIDPKTVEHLVLRHTWKRVI